VNSKRNLLPSWGGEKLKYLNVFGLLLDFGGVIIILYYSVKIQGATTKADADFLKSPYWLIIGYVLIAVGFFLQLLGSSLLLCDSGR